MKSEARELRCIVCHQDFYTPFEYTQVCEWCTDSFVDKLFHYFSIMKEHGAIAREIDG